MLYLETSPNVFELWDGSPINGIRHPLNIELLWTAEALAAINLYVPAPAATVPQHKRIVSTHVERVNGVVKYVDVTENIPAKVPSDYTLNRIQFEFIIKKLNLSDAIDAAINALPESTDEEQNVKIMARVLRDYGQTFERSHPLFTELAPLVGISAEQIDYMWMQAKDI
jgi:hypothetical protein